MHFVYVAGTHYPPKGMQSRSVDVQCIKNANAFFVFTPTSFPYYPEALTHSFDDIAVILQDIWYYVQYIDQRDRAEEGRNLAWAHR